MFIYILASKTRRLYVGVTNNLVRRAWEHRTGSIPGFTRRYGIQKKIAMINSVNPEWNDLAELWFADVSRGDPSRSLP